MFRCMYLYAANLEFILFLTEAFILTCPQLSFSSTVSDLFNPWFHLHETNLPTRILCLWEWVFFFSCLASTPNTLFKSSRSIPFPYLQCCVIYLQRKSPLIMVYFLSWGPPIFWLIFPPICIQEHSLESFIVLWIFTNVLNIIQRSFFT